MEAGKLAGMSGVKNTFDCFGAFISLSCLPLGMSWQNGVINHSGFTLCLFAIIILPTTSEVNVNGRAHI